jgi:hypothetical protein
LKNTDCDKTSMIKGQQLDQCARSLLCETNVSVGDEMCLGQLVSILVIKCTQYGCDIEKVLNVTSDEKCKIK